MAAVENDSNNIEEIDIGALENSILYMSDGKQFPDSYVNDGKFPRKTQIKYINLITAELRQGKHPIVVSITPEQTVASCHKIIGFGKNGRLKLQSVIESTSELVKNIMNRAVKVQFGGAHKRHTKKRHTKKRHTHKRRARK